MEKVTIDQVIFRVLDDLEKIESAVAAMAKETRMSTYQTTAAQGAVVGYRLGILHDRVQRARRELADADIQHVRALYKQDGLKEPVIND